MARWLFSRCVAGWGKICQKHRGVGGDPWAEFWDYASYILGLGYLLVFQQTEPLLQSYRNYKFVTLKNITKGGRDVAIAAMKQSELDLAKV